MEEDVNNLQSGNINAIWLQNIYENIKNLEMLERLAREGCNSLLDYLQMPFEQRDLIIGDLQYKNLRFIITEIYLLLSDLTPVLKDIELNNFYKALDKMKTIIEDRTLFLDEPRLANKRLKYSHPTEFFYLTLDFLHQLKINIIRSISHILYIKEEKKEGW